MKFDHFSSKYDMKAPKNMDQVRAKMRPNIGARHTHTNTDTNIHIHIHIQMHTYIHTYICEYVRACA